MFKSLYQIHNPRIHLKLQIPYFYVYNDVSCVNLSVFIAIPRFFYDHYDV